MSKSKNSKEAYTPVAYEDINFIQFRIMANGVDGGSGIDQIVERRIHKGDLQSDINQDLYYIFHHPDSHHVFYYDNYEDGRPDYDHKVLWCKAWFDVQGSLIDITTYGTMMNVEMSSRSYVPRQNTRAENL